VSDSSPEYLLERAANLISAVYSLLPRPTEPPPDHQTLPPEHTIDQNLWYLIAGLGPLAAREHAEDWLPTDTLQVHSEGRNGLERIRRRWKMNFHRRRHAPEPGENDLSEPQGG
jgi:hypothetical protein